MTAVSGYKCSLKILSSRIPQSPKDGKRQSNETLIISRQTLYYEFMTCDSFGRHNNVVTTQEHCPSILAITYSRTPTIRIYGKTLYVYNLWSEIANFTCEIVSTEAMRHNCFLIYFKQLNLENSLTVTSKNHLM